MNALERLLDRLTAGQQERVRVAHASLEEGLLTSSEFVDLVTNVILSGNAKGYNIGSALARSLVEQAVGAAEVTPAAQSTHHLDESRVREALGTVLASDQDTAMQLQRIAGNEPVQAAVDAQADVIRASGRTSGYTRDLEGGACELCVWLYKDGYVYAADKPMHRHTGCRCGMTPITK